MSREAIHLTDPSTGEARETVFGEDAAQLAERARTAREAQAGWAELALEARLDILRRLSGLLAERVETLAPILTRDTGKPIAQARNELRAAPARIDFMLDAAPRTLASEHVYDDNGAMVERIDHDPLGVVANISAWNYPYFVGLNVIAPALIAGNAVLYKPSEHALGTGRALGALIHEAGVPEDVFQVVVGAGATGQALLEAPIDGVFFTGSHATGKRIAETLAGRLLKVQLELGGKDPVYVADDVADLAGVAAGIADGAFYNTGQSCCSVERIYVHRDIYDAFVEHFTATVAGFVVGDPMDAATYIGPLARAAQLQVLEAQVDDALSRGATLALGSGKRLDRPGAWFDPTVLVGVDHSMAVMREESFGPIIGIMAVEDDAQAAQLMADSRYGLTAAVYSADGERASRILRRVPSGTSYWNCCDRVSPRLPWSGRGDSGLGLTLSTHGLLALTQPRAWHLRAPAR